MNFDSRTISAIALCIAFYLGYSHYLEKKYPNAHKPAVEQTTDSAKTAGGASVPANGIPTPTTSTVPGTAVAAPTVTKLPADQLVIETDTTIYTFNQDVAGLDSIVLKDYKAEKSPEAPNVNLLDGPMIMQGTTDPNSTNHAVGEFNTEREGRTIRFTRTTPMFKIAQEFTVPAKGFGATLKVSFTNVTAAPIDLVGGLLTKTALRYRPHKKMLGIIPGSVTERDQIIRRTEGSLAVDDIEKYCQDDKDPIKAENATVDFLGFDKHYFLNVLEPKAKTLSLVMEKVARTQTDCTLALVSYDKLGTIKPNETISVDYDGYFGPKDFAILADYNPKLEGAVDLGMFGFIARPLLSVIETFKRYTGNYGVAIILLTLTLKVLFYPLMKASSTSMFRMKKLNPQMNALREKWKDDKPRQQQELMKFMSANKINPMKGCLPILPTMPVFFALYRVLQTSIQLRHAPFYGWIGDLSAMDPYFVTPLLMGVAMFVQQRLTPNTGMDKTQEKIMMFMPVMFTFMMLTLPAGLTLYMLTNTVTGILQQRWLNYRLGGKDADLTVAQA